MEQQTAQVQIMAGRGVVEAISGQTGSGFILQPGALWVTYENGDIREIRAVPFEQHQTTLIQVSDKVQQLPAVYGQASGALGGARSTQTANR